MRFNVAKSNPDKSFTVIEKFSSYGAAIHAFGLLFKDKADYNIIEDVKQGEDPGCLFFQYWEKSDINKTERPTRIYVRVDPIK